VACGGGGHYEDFLDLGERDLGGRGAAEEDRRDAQPLLLGEDCFDHAAEIGERPLMMRTICLPRT
jgi:hypothetical protein